MNIKKIILHSLFIVTLIGGAIFNSTIWIEQYPELKIVIISINLMVCGPVAVLVINSLIALLRLFTGKTPIREIYLGISIVFLGLFITQLIFIPNLFSEVCDYWLVGEDSNSMSISLKILWSSLTAFTLIASLLFGNYYLTSNENKQIQKKKKTNKKTNKKKAVRRSAAPEEELLTKRIVIAFLLIIIIITPGFSIWYSSYRSSDNPESRTAATPIYGIPTGSHYTTELDSLSSNDQEVLDVLETVCYNIQRMRAKCGGYPEAVNPDFTMWRGDERELYPNEISLQGGTCIGGWLYLSMYEFEPNPIYLQLAKDAADALVEAQDDVTGGFFTFAEFDDENKAIEPHFLNKYRHTDYDDYVFQDNVEYLMDFYNYTGEPKYSAAANKAFDYLLETQYDSGSWPQETNFIYPFYPCLQTLNDGVMVANMRLLMKGIEVFPERADELNTSLTKAFNWICEVQGNGGSETQKGWAEQYDFNNQPEWGRTFEPPAMCTRETGLMMNHLISMYVEYNDTKYLNPVEDAYDWLMTCETIFTDCDPDKDKLTKYYELGSNNPIFGKDGGKYCSEGERVYYDITDYWCRYHNTYAETAIERWETLESVDFNITAYNEELASNSTFSEIQNSTYNLIDEITSEGMFYNADDVEYRIKTNYRRVLSIISYLNLVI